jgi:2-polyprenyl-3-methyl-5-hydroxy-6-metoxy-1,4-benzoquinol methylase
MENYLFNADENYFYSKSPDPFSYKDAGDTEKNLFEIISNSIDKSVFSQELMSRAHDWPTYYHLTSLRSNILRPFENKIKHGSTLELGAGCGAVTRFIGELGGKVTAVEGSMARARVISARCTGLPNVKVVADLIQNFNTDEKFDVVTLIGVLEYSRLYVKSDDSVQTLLELARAYLKPDGIVVLAIENQLGLKYFCGAPEDHFGCPMFGVNNSYTENSIVTFGRKELSDRCKKAGFESIKLYVPVPDYKTPVSIINANCKQWARTGFG